ncbi:MAG: cysteine--tRNA ligase [Candidatus Caldatribacteriota bacterium]|nr:cysteine--tRNA ligase [Atribacterota bacterium]MDD3031626.1 cysteine--tRNA ligase [Atribacterota bacterium]MDD3641189.1 cysteine--tRNA ligase [Atribacterota bacterium]MDD4288182.1 cysteine--tRNA ligase [Atribacterota bacterium]MDI9595977.1 cysteine--tRNA ligase [Atribacterota bacterium]
MVLKIYNTLSGTKEEFIPLRKGHVGIYVCGPTVYDFFHIGNARPFLIFEVLRRYLKFKKYNVKYVSNFTDIDDKVIKKANELGMKFSEVAEKYIQEYFQDADCLNIGRADIYPRATEHISDIIDFVKKLEEKGFAYSVDGDVFFDVNRFEEYGKLSKQNLEEIRAGERIQVDDRKRNPYDFVLWKKAKENEPSWDSPWGKGRPGWHIECSVMSTKYLGESFDIHAGGADLIFPHHENEIAQSEALSGKIFAKYWLHNGYLKIDNKKMSKSLGNILKIRELCEKYDGSVIRHFLLSAHYRSPLNFSEEQVEQSKNSMDTLINIIYNLEFFKKQGRLTKEMRPEDKELLDKKVEMESKFVEAMDDDLNTPVALSTLFLLAKSVNIYLNDNELKNEEIMNEILGFYKKYGSDILGLKFSSKKETNTILEDKEVDKMISDRELARKNKEWQKADKIREQLKSMGIILEDTAEGIRWKKG